MSNEIVRIRNIAKQHERVDTVMYALNKENLKQSAMKIAGSKAVGIDNTTKKEYVENWNNNIEDLIVAKAQKDNSEQKCKKWKNG